MPTTLGRVSSSSTAHTRPESGELPPLDLYADVVDLTESLVNISSVSGSEERLADAVEQALRTIPGLDVLRCGNAVLARTQTGKDQRIVLAGHLDTVPVAGNLPATRDGDRLVGCGTTDMKAGDAVILKMAATLEDPAYDLTCIFYDNEEVAAALNGLGRVAREYRHWLYGDLAIIMEPTNGLLEAGCQGSARAIVRATGKRAHSARSWLGVNAIHKAAEILRRLEQYQPQTHVVDGLEYPEGLNAVKIEGGVAGNVIPDECAVTVNFRYAPDRSAADAEKFMIDFFEGYELEFTDNAPSATPGLSYDIMREFVAFIGTDVVAKVAWTDVARFAAFKIPAINYGPGDPGLAHTREEWVSTELVRESERKLRSFLTRAAR